MAGGQAGKRKLKAILDEQQCLRLRLRGLTYREIAKEVGSDYRLVHRCVTQALQRIKTECAETAEDVRQIELQRLDACIKAISEQIESGKLQAIDRMLNIMSRRSKLLGLDAPVESKVNVGVAEELEKALSKLEERLDSNTYQKVMEILADMAEESKEN